MTDMYALYNGERIRVATSSTSNTSTAPEASTPSSVSKFKVPSLDAILESLIESHLHFMCEHIFEMSYGELKKIIYPNPKYKTFFITKRNSEFRVINEPRKKLKDIQYKLLNFLEKKEIKFKKCVHGFVPGRSIVTNATQHCSIKTKFVFNIDIESFFPSINFYRVRGLFMKKPFNFSYDIATVLAQICCYQNTLPQGAPTSPFIANLICRSLDKELMAVAQSNRAKYTRYCDDISFSFNSQNKNRIPEDICYVDDEFIDVGVKVKEIFKRNNFNINDSKTRLHSYLGRLEVTGVTINKFPNVKRKFIDEIRGGLNAWSKYGYEKANENFAKRDYKRSIRDSEARPRLFRFLQGKLLYVKMVKSQSDPVFVKLAEKFNALCAREGFGESIIKLSEDIINLKDAENATFVIEATCDLEIAGKSYLLGGQGTAFYLGKEIGFMTCAHIMADKSYTVESLMSAGSLNQADAQKALDIIENTSVHVVPGSDIEIYDVKSRTSYKVVVDKISTEYDLAILKPVDEIPPINRHFKFSDSLPEIGSQVTLIGYPNYSLGRNRANVYSTTVLNIFNSFAKSRIEIHEMIRTGNSGGPLVDEKFNIAGIAQKGATQDSGNNECLSAIEIKKWLDS